MIPSTVRFTGLEIDPMKIIQGRQVRSKPIPLSWTRVRFEADHTASLEKINRWLNDNINDKWHSYMMPMGFGNRVIVIAFENSSDAVLFRLKSGETAWKTDSKEQ